MDVLTFTKNIQNVGLQITDDPAGSFEFFFFRQKCGLAYWLIAGGIEMIANWTLWGYDRLWWASINDPPFHWVFLRQNVKASSLFVFSDSAYFTCSKLLTALYFQAIQNILGHRDIPIDFLPFSLNMLRVASLFREVQVVWALNEALELRNGRVESVESWTLGFGSGTFEQDDLGKKVVVVVRRIDWMAFGLLGVFLCFLFASYLDNILSIETLF